MTLGNEVEKKMATVQHTPIQNKNKLPTPNIDENEEGAVGGTLQLLSVSEQLDQQKRRENRRKMEEELKVLVVKKETVERKVRRVQITLAEPDTDGNVKSKHLLQLQLKMVESAYSEYNDFQNQIYSLKVSDETRCAEEMKFIDFERLYYQVVVQLTEKIEAVTVKNEINPAAVQPAILPYVPPLKAPLPTFDGNYENWFAFKNMFENVMARYQAESPAIKLYHLRNALVGAAAGVIDQDIINNNDYDAAWATLKERYEDKQVIIDKHIDAIYNMPVMAKENAVGLRKIIDTCCKHVDALKNLELPVEGLGEMMLVNVLSKKLDIETRKAWELTQKNDEMPKYSSTMEFLKERCRVYEKIGRCSKPAELAKQVRPAGKPESKVHSLVAAAGKCSHCREDHELWKCEVFKKANVSEKYASLRKSGSCFNCLEKGHVTGKCKSEHGCKRCGKRHHTYLHPEDAQSSDLEVKVNATTKKEIPQVTTEAGTSSTTSNNTGSALCTNVDSEQDTLLATASAIICGTGNKSVSCRAVLDSASHKHFITEELVSKLGLKRTRTNYTIIGIGGSQITIQFKVHARIRSRVNDYVSPCLELLVVKKITGELPVQQFDAVQLRIPDSIELADPTFNVPGQVDILIGSGLFFKLIKGGQLNLDDHLPAVQETHLGWIVSGLIPTSHVNISRALCTMVNEEDVGKLLEKFWHFDSYDERAAHEHSVKDTCVAHFLETHQRNEDGRFVVRLPFNLAKEQLGDSRDMAEKRFLALERRLDRDPTLKAQYVAFMREYERLGHMVEISPSDNEKPSEAFYLPHHCVLKPTSTTTKLRVVFDGSAESSSGVSINGAQHVGPTVQNDLISILLKFRSFRFAVSADIPKMYRQVMVHLDDSRFQRIVWRESRNQPLKIYALRTVTYGLTSSPFLATMVLWQLADDEEKQYPLAAEAVKTSFYIDDMLAGADSEQEATALLEEVIDMLHSGGFDVHKICSNSQAVLQTVPEEKREKITEIDDPEINMLMKTLGIVWDPTADNFTVCLPKAQVMDSDQLTKRTLLSEISRIFDPLGFIGPVLVTAKLIMREVWLLDLKWDEVIPHELAALWLEFRDQLRHVDGVKIPRWVFSEGAVRMELYGFADASDLAYGACLYARSVRDDGEAEMKLLCSKSRILPKKQKDKKEVTTPRAELQAALLLSRLAVKIIDALGVKFASVTLWSDSQIVLCWIRKSPEALQVFVGNRVKEIQSLTDGFMWRYIPSKSNPADLISRGVRPQSLPNLQMWWSGPSILNQAEYQISSPPEVSNEDLPELRRTALVCLTPPVRMKFFDRISRFAIMQRSMAYVIRYTDYIRSVRKVLTRGLPTADEMHRALLLIVRLVQKECFATEIKALKEEKDFKQPLKCLNPFIDENDDTLRVGGRIKNAVLAYDHKHQLLLPYGHPVTVALIRHLHRDNYHIGQRALLGVVRQQFWPLRAKNMIRKVVHQCTPCFRLRPKRATQLMGDLPGCRVQPSHAFEVVGVDYAGPFSLKSMATIKRPLVTKGYVCVFVCMATRAIHLEAVSNLSTDAFLGALQRFVGRRGYPRKILSDNATNFVGANNELERLAELFESQMLKERLNEFCVLQGIEWSFIPPRSPHFGGIWEAGVKSAKFHLRPILAEHKLTYEELSTVLAQVEAILNSRPLTPSSDDPNDITAITPGHFIIGRELRAIAEPSYTKVKTGRLSRWETLRKLKQTFWEIWSMDYLQELQRRQKDFKVTKFKVGSLVLVVDDNLPPLQWSLARITELHPGADGHVRVVSLQTKDSTIKRAVKNICLLPLDEEEDEDLY